MPEEEGATVERGETPTSEPDPGRPPSDLADPRAISGAQPVCALGAEQRDIQLVVAADADPGRPLSSRQAHEAAYRFVAAYYDYERIVPIRQLLEAIALTGEHSASDETRWTPWTAWTACVQATLEGEPLPDLPPPWS
jgi:hypothetical protein